MTLVWEEQHNGHVSAISGYPHLAWSISLHRLLRRTPWRRGESGPATAYGILHHQMPEKSSVHAGNVSISFLGNAQNGGSHGFCRGGRQQQKRHYQSRKDTLVLQEVVNRVPIRMPDGDIRSLRATPPGVMNNFLVAQKNHAAACLLDPKTEIANIFNREKVFRIVAADLLEKAAPNQQTRSGYEQDVLGRIGREPIVEKAGEAIGQDTPGKNVPQAPTAAKADVRMSISVYFLGPDNSNIRISIKKFHHPLQAVIPEKSIRIQHQQIFTLALSHRSVVSSSQTDVLRIQNCMHILKTRSVFGDHLRRIVGRRVIDKEDFYRHGLFQQTLHAVRYLLARTVGDHDYRNPGLRCIRRFRRV